MNHSIVPNQLRDERLAAGIRTPEELAGRAGLDSTLYRATEEGLLLLRREEFERIQAALGGMDADRLYLMNYRQLIGLHPPRDSGRQNYAELFRQKRSPEQLLVAQDEVTWLERGSMPTRPVDAFLNMSCSTQESPHLLLDTVAVCDALGLSVVAAAVAAGCCGEPTILSGNVESGERWIQAKARRIRQMDASVQVNWCTFCRYRHKVHRARNVPAKVPKNRRVAGRSFPSRLPQFRSTNRHAALGIDRLDPADRSPTVTHAASTQHSDTSRRAGAKPR